MLICKRSVGVLVLTGMLVSALLMIPSGVSATCYDQACVMCQWFTDHYSCEIRVLSAYCNCVVISGGADCIHWEQCWYTP